MPHKESNLVAPEGTSNERPKEPGLGVMLSTDGRVGVLPKGAHLAFIDPKFADSDGVVLMVLVSADRHGMKLVCPCGRKGCSRRMSARFQWTGTHPKREG